jgi:hypothetical protein
VNLKLGILTIPRSKHGELRHIQINSVARAALLKLRQHGDGVGSVPDSTVRATGIGGVGLRRW